jgi:monoamine oxidase
MSRSIYARLARRFSKPTNGPSRREVLQGSLAAAAGLLLSRASFGQDSKPASGRRVVVVGAGFAGLAAAHELRSVGDDVAVLDARNRVGGRVLTFSDFVPGKTVEGGGELIGSNHPTWVAYADKFGLGFLDVSEVEDVEFPIVIGGRRLSSEESEKLWEEMDEALTGMNADAAAVDADTPWTSPNAAALDARNVASFIDGLADVSPLCRAALHALVASDNGVPTAWQSYLGQLAQIKGGGVEKYWTESEVYRCKGGNQQLALKLAATLPKDALHLGTAAAAIRLREKGVLVTTTDGRAFEAEDVVLAIPPSTWRRVAFEPTLPGGLSPQMGVNIKALYSVKSRFWLESKLGPDWLSDGPMSQTWEGTDGQDAEGGFALHAFSGGLAAEEARGGRVEDRLERATAELSKVYKDLAKETRGARFMDWPGETWTAAGYSFPAPGEVTTIGPKLRAGVGGRLHFAGEHASHAFVGYMEGALHSGAAVAKRIAKRDGVAK